MTTVTSAAAADRCAQLTREGVVIRTATGNEIMALFEQLHRRDGIVIRTFDLWKSYTMSDRENRAKPDIAQHTHRAIQVRDGKVAEDVARTS